MTTTPYEFATFQSLLAIKYFSINNVVQSTTAIWQLDP